MRHCSSCYNCIPDIRALMICGISIDKCRKHGHLILHPFFSGFRCKGYKRKKVITDMNTSYKCNCCCKEDVCKYKDEYISDCNRIKNQIAGSTITEVSIKCTKFQSIKVNVRGIDNG